MSNNIYEELSAERKKLQAEGKLPEWFTTGSWQMFKSTYQYQSDGYFSQIKRIAKAMAKEAPTFLEKSHPYYDRIVDTYGDNWEDCFYEIMAKGHLAPSSPVLSNGGTDRGSPISCLTGDAWVNTKLDGGKRIRDICVGDEVLTHTGSYKPVTAIQSRMSTDDLFLLKVQTRLTPIKITGNHQVLTNLGWVRVDELDTHQHYIATNHEINTIAEPHIIDPYKHWNPEDYSKDERRRTPLREIPRDIEVDEDLAWALGLWFAEGSLNRYQCIVSTNENRAMGRSFRITMHHNEEHHLERYGKIMSAAFGIPYEVFRSSHGRWSTCVLNSTVVANYFGNEYGINCRIKTISRGLLDMPVNLVRKFIEGFYEGDGRKSSGKKVVFSPDIRIANPRMCMQLYEMCLKCGLDVSMSLQDRYGSGDTPRGQVHSLTFFDGGLAPRQRQKRNSFVDFTDGNRYCRFDTSPIQENEQVYDITVAGDHSFSVAGVIVHNCSGSVIGDSIHDWFDVSKETALLTKQGFGTSAYLGGIRSRGSSISGGGIASGSLPCLKKFAFDANIVSQAGVRRGSWAGYLEIDHDDFDEWADHLHKNPQSLNIGWIINKDFIARCEAGDEDSVRRFQKVLWIKMQTGKGYFWKNDHANDVMPDLFKNAGQSIKSSNLCVAPETLVLTDDGHIRISVLVNQTVNVWNGLEFSEVVIRKTASNASLVRVVLDDGRELECTPEHIFYVSNESDNSTMQCAAKDLAAGEKLIPSRCPDGIVNDNSIVVAVHDDGRTDDTYCFTEPKRHMGVFNGILTGQCSEIALPADNDHSFSCVLSSLNCSFYDDWKDTGAAFIGLVFLDCVVSNFLIRAKTILGLEKVVRFTEKSRALGLGILGFHTYLQKNMLAFEDFDTHAKNTEIFKHLDDETKMATEWMAKAWGEPEWCEGYGVRNGTRIGIAPNMSSATLAGQVSQGIEPIIANVWMQSTPSGEMQRINPQFLKLMQARNKYSKAVIRSIIDRSGSVQHLSWLTDKEKLVFKTAFEIDQRAVLRLASTRQRYIDQSQSLNLFFAADEAEEYIAQIHKEAFLDEYIKGLYYIRTLAGVQAAKDECIACEG